MKSKILYALWACLFIVCAACGFIPEPEGAVRIFSRTVSLLFFLPPALLLYNARKQGDRDRVLLIRWLSAASLSLTLVLLVLNFLTAFRSEFWGQVLHYVLTIVSSPMVAGGHWAASLFLWSFLLMASFEKKC